MVDGITQTALSDARDPHYKAAVFADWDALRETHHEMFRKVVEACEKLKAAGVAKGEYGDWATRANIAAEYGKERLIDSRIELLNDLESLNFLHDVDRPNGRFDERGRWRPHNSSRVYKPNETILLILAERAEKRIEAKKAESLESPKKPYEAESSWRPARLPTMYEQYGLGDPDSDQEAEKPESALMRFWHFLGAIDPFKPNKRGSSI